MPLLRFLEPTLHTLVSAAVFRRISLLATLADSPTEFRADRGSFTDLAPAPRGAGVSFSRVPCGTRALSTAAIAGVDVAVAVAVVVAVMAVALAE